MHWKKVKLNVNEGLVGCFTIGYRFIDDGDDNWTNRFNRFKDKKQAARYGAVNLMRTVVPLLVTQLKLHTSRTVFIPALSSNETIASEKGILSVITRVCAKTTSVKFVPDAITKKPHAPLRYSGNAYNRNKILDEADYKSRRIEAKNILVFDDFITRGETLSHIAQAIHETNGEVRVYGVGLGKNERRSYQMRRFGVKISNNHIPEEWDELWQQGEKLYRRR